MTDAKFLSATILGCTAVLLAAFGGALSETQALYTGLLLVSVAIAIVGLSMASDLRELWRHHQEADGV